MSLAKMILARADENGGCTQGTCPVSQSIYGYRPNLGATVFFLILFVVSGLTYTIQGVLRRRWFFSGAMILGSASEVLGYVAKMLLYKDPFSDTGFKMSVVLLTFAPAFYAAGIYYTFKHICLTIDPRLSRLPPKWYTYTFISADILSIVFQAIGGAIASAADVNTPLFTAGDNIMITGLVTQVFTLLIFGLLVGDYAWRVRRSITSDDASSNGGEAWSTLSAKQKRLFRWFLLALVVAYTGILIRCSYRVAELARGWVDNPILREEKLFICLDSLPVGLAALALNIFHPAWCFPSTSTFASPSRRDGHIVDAEIEAAAKPKNTRQASDSDGTVVGSDEEHEKREGENVMSRAEVKDDIRHPPRK